jgi:2,3,4,5-tetrahydropyridine-2-carboxylate N-succinyltransferase
MSKQLEAAIDAAWEKRDGINSATKGEVRDAVETALDLLDKGEARVAEKTAGAGGREPLRDSWQVNQWLKKAVLHSFRIYDSFQMDGGAAFPGMGAATWFDKVTL